MKALLTKMLSAASDLEALCWEFLPDRLEGALLATCGRVYSTQNRASPEWYISETATQQGHERL